MSFCYCLYLNGGFPGGLEDEESICNSGDLGSIPGLGRSSGGGHGNQLQYSSLENSMDRGAWWGYSLWSCKSWTWLSDLAWRIPGTREAWWAAFYGVAQSQTRLSNGTELNICCKAGLVVLNSLKFCLSEKLFLSPSILNEILVGYSNLGYIFFPFSTLNISCHSLLQGIFPT